MEKPFHTIIIQRVGKSEQLTAEEINKMITDNRLLTEEYEKSKKKTMKTITKAVIPLSDIPVKLRKNPIFKNVKIHTYIECHMEGKGKESDDALTAWLRETYPTLTRKISFLIHIDV